MKHLKKKKNQENTMKKQKLWKEQIKGKKKDYLQIMSSAVRQLSPSQKAALRSSGRPLRSNEGQVFVHDATEMTGTNRQSLLQKLF